MITLTGRSIRSKKTSVDEWKDREIKLPVFFIFLFGLFFFVCIKYNEGNKMSEW